MCLLCVECVCVLLCRIEEQGTHDELMQVGGLYAKMWAKQSMDEEEEERLLLEQQRKQKRLQELEDGVDGASQ